MRDESHVTKCVLCMSVNGFKRKGRPKKKWMDSIKDDIKKGMTVELMAGRAGWKVNTYCADLK